MNCSCWAVENLCQRGPKIKRLMRRKSNVRCKTGSSTAARSAVSASGNCMMCKSACSSAATTASGLALVSGSANSVCAGDVLALPVVMLLSALASVIQPAMSRAGSVICSLTCGLWQLLLVMALLLMFKSGAGI